MNKYTIKATSMKEALKIKNRLIKNRINYEVKWRKDGMPDGFLVDYADAYRLGFVKQDRSVYWAILFLVVFWLLAIGLFIASFFW